MTYERLSNEFYLVKKYWFFVEKIEIEWLIFGDTKDDPFWTRIYKDEFSVIQKKKKKKWISPQKIGLQLRINTHSVVAFAKWPSPSERKQFHQAFAEFKIFEN